MPGPDAVEGPAQLPVEAAVPAQLLAQVLAERPGDAGAGDRPGLEQHLVAGGQDQVGQVQVVAVGAADAAEGLGQVPLPEVGQEAAPVDGERPRAAQQRGEEPLGRPLDLEAEAVAVVDQPGEEVGGGVQHPDAARHRPHLLVTEGGRGLADGVGGEDRVGVHQHQQLAGGAPNGLVLGVPLADVLVQQPDVPAPLPPPLVDGQQGRLVAGAVVDQPDAHRARVVLAGHRAAARLQQRRVLVEAGDDHVDRRPPCRVGGGGRGRPGPALAAAAQRVHPLERGVQQDQGDVDQEHDAEGGYHQLVRHHPPPGPGGRGLIALLYRDAPLHGDSRR